MADSHGAGVVQLTETPLESLVDLYGFEVSWHHDEAAEAAKAEILRRFSEASSGEDQAYLERAYVVAALARLYPSGIRKTDIPGWKPNWHGCVYIDLPAGQISFHYEDSQAPLFAALPAYTRPYDGHSKADVFIRLGLLDGAYAMDMRKAAEYARTVLGDWLQGCDPGGGRTTEAWERLDAALAKNPNEFQTRQQGSNSDLPGSVRTEMGAVGPASECKEVIAARERLEPEGRPSADAEQCDRMGLSDARNGVTARRDEQLTVARREDGTRLMRLLASAWFHGNWKPETVNEREMQEVMERNGFWPIKDQNALMALLHPHSSFNVTEEKS